MKQDVKARMRVDIPTLERVYEALKERGSPMDSTALQNQFLRFVYNKRETERESQQLSRYFEILSFILAFFS